MWELVHSQTQRTLFSFLLSYGGGDGVGRETIVHGVSSDLYNFTLLEDNSTIVSPDGKTYGDGTARDFRDAFVFAVPPGAYKSDPSVKWLMAMAADWIPPKDSPAWRTMSAAPDSRQSIPLSITTTTTTTSTPILCVTLYKPPKI